MYLSELACIMYVSQFRRYYRPCNQLIEGCC